jgi:hypothetical protein
LIDILGDKQQAVTVYYDNAGEKPPHALLWNLTTAKSVPIKPATCGNIVDGKLWLCTTDGKMLSISQHQ